MTLTVDALIEALRGVQEAGYGHASVIIEEEGEGYFGDLLRVDTLMVGAAPTLTLVSAVAP